MATDDQKSGEEIMTGVLTGLMDDLARAEERDDRRAAPTETPKPPEGWDNCLDYAVCWFTSSRKGVADAARAELAALRAERAALRDTLAKLSDPALVELLLACVADPALMQKIQCLAGVGGRAGVTDGVASSGNGTGDAPAPAAG